MGGRILRNAHLLVRKITEGSIWIELFGAAMPVLQGMDNILIFKEFVQLVASNFGALTQNKGRLENTTTQELSNLTRMAETIANDPNGEAELLAIDYNSKTKEKSVSARILYKAKDAEKVIENATQQIKEISGAEGNKQNGLLMRLFQTNIGEPSKDRASGEKGIIEAISNTPKRLIYASELAGKKIKSAWNREGQSPYELGFIVDVDIQMVNGKPRAYRIIDVHDIFSLDESDD